jgi:CheY-like chemotaxis protein
LHASPAQELSAFLQHEHATIVRRWRRELRAWALAPPDFDAALAPLCARLARILVESDDPPRVFAVELAGRGAARYRQAARLRDAERELGLLESAILRVWGDRRGDLRADVALLVGAVVGEAVLRIARDYARAAESAEARVRLASVMRALERLSELVLVLDRRGAVAMVAGPVTQLLGRLPADLLGEPGSGPGLQALRSGREIPVERVRIRNRRSGEERTCETRAYPLREEEQVIGAVELVRDITVELGHDEELRRADRELTALHARLLRRAHGQAMAELATATASALNNELNAVSLSLSLLHQELATPSDAIARHLYAIEQAVGRGAALLARLQQLAARQPSTPPRAVLLNQVLMEALDLVRPELTTTERRTARVDARLGEVQPVLAQASELRELLCTLLLDAREAMPAGSALLLTTRDERDRAAVLLTLPLAPEARALAAEPFDGGAHPDVTDRSVNLVAARDRARRWGGDLAVEARGPRMTIRLELPHAPRSPRPAPSGPRPPLRAARRILVVDDDPGNRETLGELLGLSGHDVRGAESGAAALAALEAHPFDVALVDLAMPDMNGVELAERLRARDPCMRIALVTGWEPSAIDGGKPGLIDAVFRKPIDLPAILRFLDGGERLDGARSPK